MERTMLRAVLPALGTALWILEQANGAVPALPRAEFHFQQIVLDDSYLGYERDVSGMDHDGDADIIGICNWNAAPTWICRSNVCRSSLDRWTYPQVSVAHARLGLAQSADGAGTEDEPLKVIFDTDLDGDNDDVAAAAILHALADSGKADILATGVVSRCPYSPACLDAINTYYGRDDIPIGVYKGTTLAEMGSPYAEAVAERCPHDLGLSSEVPDVVGVYRRVLSGQADGTVTMIAVGPMNNLVDLLASPPDRHSALTGGNLVRRKVATLFVMAPYFHERNEYQRAYNFVSSPQAARKLIAQWPTKIKFGEGNLGHRHFIGSRLSETPAGNPSRIAFEAYFAGQTENKRHCADPTTVLYAVCGTQYFGEVGPGACDVREDGFTRWNAAGDKQQYHSTQKLPVWELEQVMEQLLIKPPKLQGPQTHSR